MGVETRVFNIYVKVKTHYDNTQTTKIVCLEAEGGEELFGGRREKEKRKIVSFSFGFRLLPTSFENCILFMMKSGEE